MTFKILISSLLISLFSLSWCVGLSSILTDKIDDISFLFSSISLVYFSLLISGDPWIRRYPPSNISLLFICSMISSTAIFLIFLSLFVNDVIPIDVTIKLFIISLGNSNMILMIIILPMVYNNQVIINHTAQIYRVCLKINIFIGSLILSVSSCYQTLGCSIWDFHPTSIGYFIIFLGFTLWCLEIIFGNTRHIFRHRNDISGFLYYVQLFIGMIQAGIILLYIIITFFYGLLEYQSQFFITMFILMDIIVLIEFLYFREL